MVEESLGFSPAELLFAHKVRGPLKLLREKWLLDNEPQNLFDYVSSFRSRLHRASELAKTKSCRSSEENEGLVC